MANDELPDPVFLDRAKSGDEVALRTLFARHEGQARARIVRRLPAVLRRRVSVADVLQETLLTASLRLGDFEDRGAGAFGAWLAGIAEHEVREAVRRHLLTAKRAGGREVTRGARPDTAAFAGHEPSPSEGAVAAETAERAARALEALPEDHRRVLELVQRDGLPLREAAVRMDRSYDAVKKLYGRALTRLAEGMGHRRGGEGGGVD